MTTWQWWMPSGIYNMADSAFLNRSQPEHVEQEDDHICIHPESAQSAFQLLKYEKSISVEESEHRQFVVMNTNNKILFKASKNREHWSKSCCERSEIWIHDTKKEHVATIRRPCLPCDNCCSCCCIGCLESMEVECPPGTVPPIGSITQLTNCCTAKFKVTIANGQQLMVEALDPMMSFDVMQIATPILDCNGTKIGTIKFHNEPNKNKRIQLLFSDDLNVEFKPILISLCFMLKDYNKCHDNCPCLAKCLHERED